MHKTLFLSLAFLLALATPAAAQDYIIDSDETTADPIYNCLNELQIGHSTLLGVNSITFKTDDTTLQNEFTLDDNSTLTLAKDATNQLTISAATGAATRFLCATNSVTINWASGLTFSGFTAPNNMDGGAVYVGQDLSGSITGSTFTGNIVTNGSGGAMFVNGNSTAAITDSTFNGNSARWSGGAMYVGQNLNGNISGSTFTGNTATNGYGGALYVNGALTGDISKSTFHDSSAGLNGGAVCVYDGFTGNIIGSKFETNTAGGSGGALYVYGALNGNITDSTFIGNSATSESGGALYVDGKDLNGQISGSTFEGNSAGLTGGAVSINDGGISAGITKSTFNTNSATNGGAVFVNFISGGITDSTFNANSATNGNGGAVLAGIINNGITGSTFSGNSATNGNGGAVYVDNNLEGAITNSTFESNSAGNFGGAVFAPVLRGDITGSTFTGNSATSSGGAVHTENNIEATISGSTFESNSAGNYGGAVFAAGGITGDITGSTFSGNSATNESGGAVYTAEGITGDISSATFTGNSAGYAGGAVYVNSNLEGAITNSTFNDNTATSEGGALHVRGDISSDISGSAFSTNSAGSGGAMYAYGNVALNGAGASFSGNRATGIAGDDYSGRGGAIFHDAGQPEGSPAKTFKLSATAGDPIVFEDNTHNPGNSGEITNSIYFGNSWPDSTYSDHDGQVDATFNVAADGALYMLDPMASQEDDIIVHDPNLGDDTNNNLALNINKTGPGVWVLAGHNDMQSATNWVISEGVLHLVADSSGQPAHIELANTTNKMNVTDYASFTVKSGASLLVEPAASPHQISGQSITLESGSSVGLQGFQYGPKMDSGRYQVLALNASALSNQSGVPQTEGTIAVGAYKYNYTNLHWEGDDALFVNLESVQPDPGPDPVLSGAPSITGASHIAALNPAFNIFRYHAKGLFGWNNLPYQEYASSSPRQYAYADNQVTSDVGYGSGKQSQYLNNLWVIPNYVNVNQSGGGNNVGYLLQTPGFALGYDRQLNENAFVGLGVSLSWPDYEDGTTDINATDITFALYGGVKLPYALELDGHAGFGFTRYDQDRRVENERYSEKYNGNNFFVGLGLGRPFALGGGFSLRPGVAYDFIHLNIDGFDEGAGTYAIKADDYSQNLHRVKAGLDLSWTEANSGLSIGGEVYYLGVYGDRVAETTGHFVADPVNGFTMIGNGLDRDNLGLGLRVSLPVSERWELGAGYNVLFGSDTVSQQGLLSAAYKF